jgi:uncharacterized protein (TIRG00374 family)
MDLGALRTYRRGSCARTGRWKTWRTLGIRTAAGLFVSLILIVIYTRLVDVPSVFARLGHLNLGLALLCGAAFLSAYAVRALRWRLFLAPHPVSVRRAVAIYQVATFINVLLPVQGGELVKSLLLRRLNGIPVSESLPTVAMDKMLDLLPAVGLLVLLPFLPVQLGGTLWVVLLIVLALFGLGIGAIGLAAWHQATAYRLLTNVTARLPRGLGQRVERFVAHFAAVLLSLIGRPRRLLLAGCITALAVCLDALYCYLAFQAIGAHVPVLVILFGYTLFNLCFILPNPPGQVGSVELIGLLVFSTVLHIDRSTVATALLFDHPWTVFLLATTGLLSLSAMGISLRAAFTLEREVPTIEERQPPLAPPFDDGAIYPAEHHPAEHHPAGRARDSWAAVNDFDDLSALMEDSGVARNDTRAASRKRAANGDESHPGSELVLAHR